MDARCCPKPIDVEVAFRSKRIAGLSWSRNPNNVGIKDPPHMMHTTVGYAPAPTFDYLACRVALNRVQLFVPPLLCMERVRCVKAPYETGATPCVDWDSRSSPCRTRKEGWAHS
eukprot:scaffold1501_cov352-Pavlova_lutheri.AAC.34